jgi:hypothetical protein
LSDVFRPHGSAAILMKANRLTAGSSNESAFKTIAIGDIHGVDALIAETGAIPPAPCPFGN